MKPSERLKEIEKLRNDCCKEIPNIGWENEDWLINRVKRLTTALEKIAEDYDSGGFGAFGEVARKVLKEDDSET